MILQFLQVISPILTALAGVGLTGYLVYIGSQPKNKAQAQKVNAEVLVTFADGWKSLYEEEKLRVDRLEKRISLMESLIEEREKNYNQTLAEKEAVIQDLQKEISELNNRIDDLEKELLLYKKI